MQIATHGLLEYRINGTLSKNELATLQNTANMCPDFNGQGVYLARSVISTFTSRITVYSDDCANNNDEREARNMGGSSSSNQFSVYPNPNNGGFTVKYDLQQGQAGVLTIYSMLGQKEAEYALDASSNLMNVNNNALVNGIHLYVIRINNNEVKRDKLIIIK